MAGHGDAARKRDVRGARGILARPANLDFILGEGESQDALVALTQRLVASTLLLRGGVRINLRSSFTRRWTAERDHLDTQVERFAAPGIGEAAERARGADLREISRRELVAPTRACLPRVPGVQRPGSYH